jgi:hypothetical protein
VGTSISARSLLSTHGSIGPDPGTPNQSTTGKVVSTISNLIEEVPVASFAKFLKISAKRAFRLRIEPSEVLRSERYALAHANPPIVEPNLQAFLAWRRSVLFLVACALVPLTIIGLYNGATGRMPDAIRTVKLAPAIAEALFLVICWWQLRHWHHWRTAAPLAVLGLAPVLADAVRRLRLSRFARSSMSCPTSQAPGWAAKKSTSLKAMGLHRRLRRASSA